ncbi:MAG: hypothetical protein NVSMB56_09910 [Pyrinomonadaceae bacterium]
MMRTRLKLKPGARGTKKLTALYGAQLVCVRYRYDADRSKRFKTVELIIEEVAWTPKPKSADLAAQTMQTPPPETFDPTQIVSLRVGRLETETQDAVKRAGGRWNPDERAWRLRRDKADALGLTLRIIPPTPPQASNDRYNKVSTRK